ncbi:DUF4185 domain-containing protein [Microlunatus speluncae]|uniref:DUF4185 domain-containing protein n=1 Tax=Microlunatus speluncae TaxID=2594267 RepID=UPI00126617A6|nr:DUF4185 domain-containing protein [Microlunatus speluncae]
MSTFNPRISRSTLLRGTAGVVAGGALAGLAAGSAEAQPLALTVNKVKDLTGPGLTTEWEMEATDLGIPVSTPDGRTLYVFGDTFEHTIGDANWRSPVGLYSTTTNLAGGVTWSGAVGGATARQFWDYPHNNPEFSTVLPSDVIKIGNRIYLHAMVNKGLGNVIRCEIWYSDDSGNTWIDSGARIPGNWLGGMAQLVGWGLGNDDYVYIYSTGFQRDKPIILHRVRTANLTNYQAWEPWGYAGSAWNWGNPPTPILDGRFGEMSFRPLGGKWILTWFNEGDYRIEGLIADTPTSNLHTAKRATFLHGTSWGNEDDTHVAQLYGGYVIPGSTLDDLHLAVSQWNTTPGANNWPYRVMQFRVQGFGSS